MQTYERHGVHLEKCDACRGIFLDKGELEQLLAAEGDAERAPAPPPIAAYQPPAPAAPPAYQPPVPSYQPSPGQHYGHYPKKKRKRHILEDLFEL